MLKKAEKVTTFVSVDIAKLLRQEIKFDARRSLTTK